MLGLTLWEGDYEDVRGVWLRWCNLDGSLLRTGQENAAVERARADEASQRAEALAAKLRALGIDPDA